MIKIEKGFITFSEGNNFPFFQDMRFGRGVPANIRFKVDDDENEFFNSDTLWLIADNYGFGITGKPDGRYGNGAIGIKKEQILDYLLTTNKTL